MRLINADKLYPDCMTKDGRVAISASQIASAQTIEERPKGKWIREKKENLKGLYRCSVCGRRVSEVDDYLLLDEDYKLTDVYPYCHCGAEMEA